jgi:predicted nuclease with RNAse H fold
MNIAGIDFGSQKAGTTAIAWKNSEECKVQIAISIKNQNADAFLQNCFNQIKPTVIAIDAPLSLPGVYRHMKGYEDYFYRQGDRIVKAMSPLFLGGLTARAMQLADTWHKSAQVTIIETYPRLQAERLQLLEHHYKKEKTYIPQILTQILQHTNWKINTDVIENWHQIDALLALVAAERYQKKATTTYGNEKEGLIYV